MDYVEAVVKAVSEYAGVKYIPPTGSGEYYTVKVGDSLWKIANMYGVTVNELKSVNNLSSNLLSVGQKLTIPDNSSKSSNTYIVKAGDSLWNIAKKYNVTVNELKSVNNLTDNLLKIGQKLIIPSNNKTYIVKSGDSLWKIAKDNNVSVDDLIALNNLNNNLLQIGQTLLIP